MNKWKKLVKNCPLVVCILCSWAIVAVAEHLPLAAKETPSETGDAQGDHGWTEDQTEILTANDILGGAIAANRAPDLSEQAIMDGDGAGVDGAENSDATAGAVQTDGTVEADGVQSDGATGSGDGRPAGNTVSEGDDGKSSGVVEQKPKKIKPKYISYEKKNTDSPWYTDPGKIPMTTEYPYQQVDDDYFDDAVFIGDSRIVGMYDYSGLTNATFFAKTGLTVYNLLDDEFVKDPDTGKNVSVSDMLQKHKYGKIYLMVGINELGTGGTQRFADAYKAVLKSFRKWQPDAVIYVQSIMGVSPKKDQKDPVFNNTNIRDKNYAIAKLTDGIHIFYLNIQEIYEDKNHNLEQDLTFDDVHLYAQHYDKWVDYLKTHAVVKGEKK